MNTLKFARELARFEGHLDWVISNSRYDPYGDQTAPIAATLKQLIDDLVELGEAQDSPTPSGDTPQVVQIVADALATYNALTEQGEKYAERQREIRQAEYAEAARRHELAITVECPYCGSRPGQSCRTAGPSGKSQPKGVHDHLDRHRAATDPSWKAGAADGERESLDDPVAINEAFGRYVADRPQVGDGAP